MLRLGYSALLLLLALGPPLHAQVASGLYGNLTIGVDGTSVTGAFANARPGTGTDDAPQFACVFVLHGTLAQPSDKSLPVTVWSPAEALPASGAQAAAPTPAAQTTGTLSIDQGTAKLKLQGEPPGCAETQDEFAAKAYEEPSVRNGSWKAARIVTSDAARLQEAPVGVSGSRGRVSKGDVVVVYRTIGPWLEVEPIFARKAVRGWIRQGDVTPDAP